MPPINQQGSRTPLVTALVVFTILFVVSTVFAINYYGKWQQAVVDREQSQKLYNGFLTDAAIGTPDVQALVAAKTESPSPFGLTASESAMDVALRQRNVLAGVITGSTSDQTPTATYNAAQAALRDASTKLKGAKLPLDLTGGGLDVAVTRLADALVKGQQLQAELKGQATAAEDSAKQKQAMLDDQAAASKKAADAATQANAESIAQLTTANEQTNATLKTLQTDQTAAGAAVQASTAQAADQLTDAKRQLASTQVELQKVQAKLANHRPYVDDAAVRQSDGQLIRVPGGGVCYINLGFGSGVTNGLTFEVYDKLNGVPTIPPTATGDEQLPVGKASIEIIHVGQNSSECRIVKQMPGVVLTEGDPIANLVYDAHQKYKFDVYGSFDLAKSGRPTTADAEVVKRLITQWGGTLIDRVSPDTDFLVIGAEPVLPEFSKDDLTPENQDKLTKAQEALDKYQEVLGQAKALHIPVLNQNRFLYYIGYYDQATR